MATTPRRTPGSQSPTPRASERRPTGSARRGAAPRSRKPDPAETPKNAKKSIKDTPPAVKPASARVRATRRPSPGRTAASRDDGKRFNRRPSGRFTGRAAIIAVVISVLVLSLAYPVQRYLGQRTQIAEIEADQAAQRERISGLENQVAKWNDPAYVKAQARKRLQLVEPGVVMYYVYGNGDEPSTDKPNTDATPSDSASSKSPWYTQLWSSVQAADEPATAGRK